MAKEKLNNDQRVHSDLGNKFTENPLSRKEILLRLWKYIGHNKLLPILAVILAFVGNLLALYGPKLSGEAINAIDLGKGKVDFDAVFYYVTLMLICYALSAVFSYILSIVMVKLSRKIANKMRSDIFASLSRMPVSFFDKYQAGNIISVVTYDVDTVNQSFSSDLLQIIQSAITVTVAFVMMITISPRLVLIFVFTIPATILFTRWLAGRVRPLFRKRSAKLGELNGFVEEMLSGQKTIRAYAKENEVLCGFDAKNREAVDAYTVAEANGTITGPCVNFINNISLTLVCVFGSFLFLKGGIKLGDLSGFVQYSRKFSGPINEVANIIAELQSAFAAAERVFALIDALHEAEDLPDAGELTDVSGHVEIKNINFSYVPEKPIIKNFSLDAKPGSVTAIVGHTGAGKTTIINLLMRFYDVGSGEISVDGKNIMNIKRASLRKAYAMVLQDTWLFHGTVFENISYARPDATMEDVVRVAKAAHIHNFIKTLPNGYDTILSDNASGISKGQKQLLTIARAMLADAHMLILDEATSNVDTETEQKIQSAMLELMRGKTCFVIAHRLSTIKSADNILVMSEGSCVEQGNHENLMAKRGVYFEMYRSQFE